MKPSHALVDYYERKADEYIRQTLGVDMTALYARFLPRLPPQGLVLDAGCGSGRDARAFKDRGFRVVAFDAARRMAEHASALTGTDVLCMTFADIRWEDVFDGIWCCASLLHVPKVEFLDVATKLLRALKPGGIWYLSFKLGEGQHMLRGRLFVHHTDKTLRNELEMLPAVKTVDTWITADGRQDRQTELWVNALVAKRAPNADAR